MSQTSVSDVQYVGLAVADLETERRFFRETWGLRETSADPGLAHFAAEGSDAPYVIRLRQASAPRLDLIGFSAHSRQDVHALYDKLQAMEAKLISSPRVLPGPAGGYGFRFFDPDGRTLEIASDVARGPARELARGESIPVGLSHVVLHSPDVSAAVKFYSEALGFRVSDWLGTFMCFLRCNRAHHRLAFLPGPAALNHIAFEMRSVDEMMSGLARLAQQGVKTTWGPGRHTAGDNTFAYFATPSGVGVEYTAELELVDEATWRPTVYAMAPEVTDRWGTGRLFVDGPPHKPPTPDAGLWTAPPV